MRAPGQRTRNQLALIAPTLALAVRVQRNGHNHLRPERLRLARATSSASRAANQAPKASDFLVFQQEDGVMQRVLVNAVAAGEVEGVVVVSTEAANRLNGFGGW